MTGAKHSDDQRGWGVQGLGGFNQSGKSLGRAQAGFWQEAGMVRASCFRV